MSCSEREEYKRGFGVPTFAVHPENDPNDLGLAQAKHMQ
jgi:ketol-acid reductoisomerase